MLKALLYGFGMRSGWLASWAAHGVKGRSGFTLIEVLIVLVVLGVLAGLAIPVMTSSSTKAYKAEALEHLSAMRGSMVRYYAEYNTYSSAALTNLDYNPNTAVAGQTPSFSYAVTSASGTTFSLTATGSIAAVTGKTVTINQAGTRGGNL